MRKYNDHVDKQFKPFVKNRQKSKKTRKQLPWYCWDCEGFASPKKGCRYCNRGKVIGKSNKGFIDKKQNSI